MDVSLRIGWSGVGINLKTNRPKPQQIKEAVREVLSNAQYRHKAQEMQEEFSKMDAATAGTELIEKLWETG